MSRNITSFEDFTTLATQQLTELKEGIEQSEHFEYHYMCHTVDTYLNTLKEATKAKRKNIRSFINLAKLSSVLTAISPNYLPLLFLPQFKTGETAFKFSTLSEKLVICINTLLNQLQQAATKNPSILSTREQERLTKLCEKTSAKLTICTRYHTENNTVDKIEDSSNALRSHNQPTEIQLKTIADALQLLESCPMSIIQICREPLTDKARDHIKNKFKDFLKLVSKYQPPQATMQFLEYLQQEGDSITLTLKQNLQTLANNIRNAINQLTPEVKTSSETTAKLTTHNEQLQQLCKQRSLILKAPPISLQSRIHCQQLKHKLTEEKLTPWTKNFLQSFFKVQLLTLHAIPNDPKITNFFRYSEKWIIMTAISMHPLLQKQQQSILKTSLEQLHPPLRNLLPTIMNHTEYFLGEHATKSAFTLASTFNSHTLPDNEYTKSTLSKLKSTVSHATRAVIKQPKTSYTVESIEYEGVTLITSDPLAQTCWNIQHQLFQIMQEMQFNITEDILEDILTYYTDLGTALTMLSLALVTGQDYNARFQHIQETLAVICKSLLIFAFYEKNEQLAFNLIKYVDQFKEQVDSLKIKPSIKTTHPTKRGIGRLFRSNHNSHTSEGSTADSIHDNPHP